MALAQELCEYLEWDSTFFCHRIGRINGHTLTDAQAQEVLAWAHSRQVACLYFLADPSDLVTLDIANRRGFQLTDVRVTLERRTPQGGAVLQATPVVRPWGDDDIPSLRAIAASCHHDTRFYYDGHFPRQLCDELYATWIEKSCFGYADQVIVAELDRKVTGYVSLHRESTGLGHIGLIAVAPSSRQLGCGRALIQAAGAWFDAHHVTTVSVATQGRNPLALRLYERCGFNITDIQLWYHWWPASNLEAM